MNKFIKAEVGLTKGDDGFWLNIRTSSDRQASLALDQIAKSPMVLSILKEWAEEAFENV
jgi:hypothetical protein